MLFSCGFLRWMFPELFIDIKLHGCSNLFYISVWNVHTRDICTSPFMLLILPGLYIYPGNHLQVSAVSDTMKALYTALFRVEWQDNIVHHQNKCKCSKLSISNARLVEWEKWRLTFIQVNKLFSEIQDTGQVELVRCLDMQFVGLHHPDYAYFFEPSFCFYLFDLLLGIFSFSTFPFLPSVSSVWDFFPLRMPRSYCDSLHIHCTEPEAL